MEPFFFYTSGPQLYGVFHAGDPGRQRGRSVLLLYPLGHEYMRIHRAYRRLAETLAEMGFDVLRFDYANTGDSAGDFNQLTLQACVKSAEAAYDELVSLSPGNLIDVVGLRVGTIIARSLANDRSVHRLVLWEPKHRDEEFLEDFFSEIRTKGKTRSNFVDNDGVLHYAGFAYNRHFQSDLRDGSWLTFKADCEMLAISSFRHFDHTTIAQNLRDSGAQVSAVEGPDDWTTLDSIGGLFFPEPSLHGITTWLDS